jgi:hypothetical protein
LDAKASVAVGAFSRRGKSRLHVKALDHDFRPELKVTPYGIYLPELNELYLYLTSSIVTSDFIMDCLSDLWHSVRSRFPQVTGLLLDLDNGPENHSRRTQFMARVVEFVDTFQITVQLAYYPPYHSKYNPIERVWGGLEQHWNGALLDSLETVFQFAASLLWRGVQPIVEVMQKVYQTGARLTPKQMNVLELRLNRLSGLEKYFVSVTPTPAT